jgi:predicted ATPase
MIKRIKIRDFKSIRELDLELDPVTVLIGRSGTGKSNLVHAIRFLRNLLLNYELAIAYEKGWHCIVPVGQEEPKTSIEVLFALPGDEVDYTYAISFGTPHGQKFGGHLELTGERLTLGSKMLFSRHRDNSNSWKWDHLPDLSPRPAASVEHLMLGRLPSLQTVVFAYAALSTGTGYYHFPASTLAQDPPHDRGRQLFQGMPGLSDDAANYLEVMRGITQDFHRPNIRKSLLASLQAVNSSIQSAELDSMTNPQQAIIGHRARDRVFALSLTQESDGLRRFYAHLLALYQTPSKLTLVFEEPENAIFPGALSLLADEFKAAPQENRGQVILTTHSPILLDSFNVDTVRVVDMVDGNTVVGPIAKEQRQAVKDHLLNTGELLTVERARLDEEAGSPQPS